MTLQQLKYVITISEIGNMTLAAEKLFISQPSLTNSIKKLEDELGINIFNRSSRGVRVSLEGEEFLAYARQILDQVGLLEKHYLNVEARKAKFSVSCQHYSFAISAMVDLVKEFDADEYDFTLRETQTHEIIEDVAHLKSELGIIYLSSINKEVILKMLNKNDLIFDKLFTAKPHVFISSSHPLAKKDSLTLEDLDPYPYLSFEQGQFNSFYYSEEILSSIDRKKNIRVCDRATLFNLVIGLNGYTVSTGIISNELNGEQIISKALKVDEDINVGIIRSKNINLSRYALYYIDALKKHIHI